MFTAGSGSEEDPFVIDDEVPQRSPCSSCAKESYAGPVRTGQRCTPRGRRPGSSPSEDSNAPRRRFEIWRRQATPNEGSSMGGCRSTISAGVGLRGSEERQPSTSSMMSHRLRLEMSPQGWRVRYRFRFRHLSSLHPVVRDRRCRESPWTRFLVI